MIFQFMAENVHVPPYEEVVTVEEGLLEETKNKKKRKRISPAQKKMGRKIHFWKISTLIMAIAAASLVLPLLLVARNATNFRHKLAVETGEHNAIILHYAQIVEGKEIEISALKERLGRKSDIKTLTKINGHIELLEPSLDPTVRMVISKAIEKWCNEYNLSYSLVTNLIYAETAPKFNIFSKSPKDCIGLMQINYEVHKKDIPELAKISIEELYHIDTNVKFGCMILRGYIDNSKTLTKALKRYVGGSELKYISLIYAKMALWEVSDYTIKEEENVVREVQETDARKNSSE